MFLHTMISNVCVAWHVSMWNTVPECRSWDTTLSISPAAPKVSVKSYAIVIM